jgi:hypothetical protein
MDVKTYLKLELKKAIFSWKTILSIVIILALLVIPFLGENGFPHMDIDGIDYFIDILNSPYIGFIGPVIAGLIYSTSIIKDKESGFLNKLLEVIDIKTYFKIKFAVNALINFIVFAVSYGILILYLIINYGMSNKGREVIDNGAFSSIYNISKIAYVIIVLLVISISAAAFSAFIFGVTTAINSKLIAYILPIFYAIVTGIIFQIWTLNNIVDFNVTTLFNVIISHNKTGVSVIVYDLMLTLVGVLMLYKFGYKRFLALNEKS